MAKSNVTIEDLARMVKLGFDETAKDLNLVKYDVHEIKERVENIEKILIKQHSLQIKSLEKRMKRMEDLFALK